MSVRVAVIGAGNMGADHAALLAADVSGAQLRVVCDADAARAGEVAALSDASAETDPLATIARADVDAVLIASPDDTHAALVLACLAAGKPVLCEKPLAPTTDECLRVLAAEVQAGRPLVQIGFMRRFDPSYTAMKQALDDGTLGRALMMHNFHRTVSSPGTWFTGAMAITNAAGHEFDVARFVLGSEFVAISAWQPRRSDDMTAPVMMVLETADGQVVNVEVNNNAAYGYDVRGELVGETGAVALKGPFHATYNLDLQVSQRFPADWRPWFREAYRLQDKAWIAAIQAGVPSSIAATAWDGYCATAVAEAGVRALDTGTRVAIDMARKPDFYRDLATAG